MLNTTEVPSLNETLGAGAEPGAGGEDTSGHPTLTAESIVVSCILAVFCVLGTVGNALAFLIYYRKREKGTSTIFILSLAITDFFTCIIVIPFSIAYEALTYKLQYNVVCKLYHFVITFNIPLSSLILVAIGFDRYLCICHPFLHAITVPRAKLIIVILTVVSALMGVVPALNHTVHHHTVELVNETVPRSQLLAMSPPRGGSLATDPSSSSSSSSGNTGEFSPSSNDFDLDINPTPASPEDGEAGGSTHLYTDGLFLNPDKDFLNEYTGHGISYKTATDGTPVIGGPTSPAPRVTLGNGKGRGRGLNVSSLDPEDDMVVIQRNRTVATYFPYCFRSTVTISIEFSQTYQKAYASVFLVEFIILAFLYALIYRSIFLRRAWKAKRRQKSGYSMTNCHETEETQLTNINGASTEPNAPKKSQGRISAAMRDRTLYANIRTAAMLFVVTVVFVVSFLPSWLMGLKFLPFNVIVFYMFYVNNVINPFIYAFMNKSFRDDLVQLIKNCVWH